MKIFRRIWQDDAAFVISTELVLVATILVIGIVTGLNAVRNSVTNELADVGAAVNALNQSYVVMGVQGHGAALSGWQFADEPDFCECVGEPNYGVVPLCITQNVEPGENEDDAPEVNNP